MLNTVNTIIDRVDDPESVLMAANATVGVSSNTGQMNTKNQDSGSAIIDMLGQKAQSFVDNPAVVGDLASTMLKCGGNMLTAGQSTAEVDDSERLSPDVLVCVFFIFFFS